MNNKEILGLHRITKPHLKQLCKKHRLYQTPHLNDQLYLHFQGFQAIENLEEYTGLKCLWLESNAISEIQGLDCQTELKCLFLQNNLIKKIENLQACAGLDTLNLASNHITRVENCGVDVLPVLSSLNLSRNYLKNSDGLQELLKCTSLWSLDLANNRIDDILVVKIFANMPELRVLVLQGNPVVSQVPQYRKTLILECKNLTYLDSRPVCPKDRACAEAWKRGGYEEERREHDRWVKMDRKKIRDSVNATLRLRQKHGAGDVQLLESTDDEEEENRQPKKLKKTPKELKKIPKESDLEITGVECTPDAEPKKDETVAESGDELPASSGETKSSISDDASLGSTDNPSPVEEVGETDEKSIPPSIPCELNEEVIDKQEDTPMQETTLDESQSNEPKVIEEVKTEVIKPDVSYQEVKPEEPTDPAQSSQSTSVVMQTASPFSVQPRAWNRFGYMGTSSTSGSSLSPDTSEEEADTSEENETLEMSNQNDSTLEPIKQGEGFKDSDVELDTEDKEAETEPAQLATFNLSSESQFADSELSLKVYAQTHEEAIQDLTQTTEEAADVQSASEKIEVTERVCTDPGVSTINWNLKSREDQETYNAIYGDMVDTDDSQNTDLSAEEDSGLFKSFQTVSSFSESENQNQAEKKGMQTEEALPTPTNSYVPPLSENQDKTLENAALSSWLQSCFEALKEDEGKVSGEDLTLDDTGVRLENILSVISEGFDDDTSDGASDDLLQEVKALIRKTVVQDSEHETEQSEVNLSTEDIVMQSDVEVSTSTLAAAGSVEETNIANGLEVEQGLTTSLKKEENIPIADSAALNEEDQGPCPHLGMAEPEVEEDTPSLAENSIDRTSVQQTITETDDSTALKQEDQGPCPQLEAAEHLPVVEEDKPSLAEKLEEIEQTITEIDDISQNTLDNNLTTTSKEVDQITCSVVPDMRNGTLSSAIHEESAFNEQTLIEGNSSTYLDQGLPKALKKEDQITPLEEPNVVEDTLSSAEVDEESASDEQTLTETDDSTYLEDDITTALKKEDEITLLEELEVGEDILSSSEIGEAICSNEQNLTETDDTTRLDRNLSEEHPITCSEVPEVGEDTQINEASTLNVQNLTKSVDPTWLDHDLTTAPEDERPCSQSETEQHLPIEEEDKSSFVENGEETTSTIETPMEHELRIAPKEEDEEERAQMLEMSSDLSCLQNSWVSPTENEEAKEVTAMEACQEETLHKSPLDMKNEESTGKEENEPETPHFETVEAPDGGMLSSNENEDKLSSAECEENTLGKKSEGPCWLHNILNELRKSKDDITIALSNSILSDGNKDSPNIEQKIEDHFTTPRQIEYEDITTRWDKEANDLSRKTKDEQKVQVSTDDLPKKTEDETLKPKEESSKEDDSTPSAEVLVESEDKLDNEEHLEGDAEEVLTESQDIASPVKSTKDDNIVVAEPFSQPETKTEASTWWEATLAAAREPNIVKTPEPLEESLPTDDEDQKPKQNESECNPTDKQSLEDKVEAFSLLEDILASTQKTEVQTAETEEPVPPSNEDTQSTESLTKETTDDNESYEEEPLAHLANPSATLREVLTSFNEAVESITVSSKLRSQRLRELIDNPLTKELAGESADEINRQVKEMKRCQRERVSQMIDRVYAQKDKYNDTLELVDGRLMVVKQSTGELEELPPPPGQSKYTSCGISTTQTNWNDSDSDAYGTALSEDELENDGGDIEQHASDTKIKKIPYFTAGCRNEPLSLTNIDQCPSDKEGDERPPDSQRSIEKLHSDIDVEVFTEIAKWMEDGTEIPIVQPTIVRREKGREEILLMRRVSKESGEVMNAVLDGSNQSVMDCDATALEDVTLIFEIPKAEE